MPNHHRQPSINPALQFAVNGSGLGSYSAINFVGGLTATETAPGVLEVRAQPAIYTVNMFYDGGAATTLRYIPIGNQSEQPAGTLLPEFCAWIPTFGVDTVFHDLQLFAEDAPGDTDVGLHLFDETQVYAAPQVDMAVPQTIYSFDLGGFQWSDPGPALISVNGALALGRVQAVLRYSQATP